MVETLEQRLDRQDREFAKLRQEIQDIIDDAEKHGVYLVVPGFASDNLKPTSQDKNTGTGSKLAVAVAECQSAEEIQ